MVILFEIINKIDLLKFGNLDNHTIKFIHLKNTIEMFKESIIFYSDHNTSELIWKEICSILNWKYIENFL